MTLDTTTINAHGLTFRVSVERDDDCERPWKCCDGHGPVREGSRSDYGRHISKRAGEVILHQGDRNRYSWVYDWAGALKLAAKDGWGVSPEHRPAMWDTLTAKQQTEVAVQRDFDYLKAWCEDEWVYAGVYVQLMIEDEDGDLVDYDGPLQFDYAIWGVEFWQMYSLSKAKNKYAMEIASERIDSIAKKYRAEQAEAQACAERDIMTVAA